MMIDDKITKGMIRTAIVLSNNDHDVPEIINILCVVHHDLDQIEIASAVRSGIEVYQSLCQACEAVSRQELRVEYMTGKMTAIELMTLMAEKGLRFIAKEKLAMLSAKERLGDGLAAHR